MDLILRIIGILALLLILGLGAIIAFVWWHWRKIKKGLAAVPPLTITLVTDTAPDWVNQAPFHDVILEFKALGFTPVGPFEIDGLAGVRVLGMCHPPSGFRGCCYNHPAVGCFVDLCANLDDGLELTVTNAPSGSEMDTRPGTEKIFLAGRPLPELHATLQTKIAGRPVTPCVPAHFQEDFVAAYARDMAWHTNKLGVSEAEFRRFAANEKRTFSEEQLTAAFQETKLQELRQWTTEATEEFAKTTTLSVARWKEFEESQLIYRDDFHPGAFLDYVAESVDIPCDIKTSLRSELATGLPLTGLLDKITAATGCSFVHLGPIERPLRCEVYGVKQPSAAG